MAFWLQATPQGCHQQTKNLAELAKRKLYMRNLAKIVFAKSCETRICETLRILRNKRKTAKKAFAKPCQCETRICKTCETWVAKQCETMQISIAKHKLRNLRKLRKLSSTAKLWCKTTKHCKQQFYNSTTTGCETTLRQRHWDATVGYRHQYPAPYHRKHRGTFLPVPHATSASGAQRGRRFGGTVRRHVEEAAAADGEGTAGSEAPAFAAEGSKAPFSKGSEAPFFKRQRSAFFFRTSDFEWHFSDLPSAHAFSSSTRSLSCLCFLLRVSYFFSVYICLSLAIMQSNSASRYAL